MDDSGASLLDGRYGCSVTTRSYRWCRAGLGHASAAETLDTYSHMWPDNEDGGGRPWMPSSVVGRTLCGLLRISESVPDFPWSERW